MSGDHAVKGTIEGSVRAAKAAFAKVEEERLRAFIARQPDVGGAVRLSNIRYPTEGAGSSNGIAFLTAHIGDEASTRTLQLVLRYSPGTQLLKQKNFADEYRTLQAVADVGLPVPRVFWLDETGEELGHPGYVMEAVEGDPPSAAMYSGGPLANISPEERKSRMLKAAGFHGRLRAAAIGADRVPHLRHRGEGSSAIERELSWWLAETLMANAPDDHKVETVSALRDWLIRHQPADLYSEGLVHGDAQIANMIYADGDIAAVIDWELSYLGHNEADLALICFLTKAQHIVDIAVEGTPTDEEYIARFEEESGCKVQHWEYFKLFNMYRIMAVTSLAAHYMPSFDAVWAFHKEMMDDAWAQAKGVYGA